MVAILLVVISWLHSACAAEWTPLMVADYFSARNVTHIDAVVCTKKDELSLFEHIHSFEPTTYFRSLKYFNTSMFTSDRLGIFVDMTCDRPREMIMDASKRWSDGWFDRNQTWLFWDPVDDCTTNALTSSLATFSDVVIGKPEGLTRLRKIWRSLPLEKVPAGLWTNETHRAVLIPNDVKLDFHQSDVRGAITNIYTDINDHVLLRKELLDPFYVPGLDIINRFHHAIIVLFAELYNYKLVYMTSKSWGREGKNGNWSGMLGMMQRDEADLTVTPMVPISCRTKVAAPTIDVAPYWIAIVFRQPRALGTYKAMTLELSGQAWACVMGLVLVGAIVFSVVQQYDPADDTSADGSWSMGLVQSVGIIANQGLCLVPLGTSSRIVSLALLMVSLIVSTYYNAATLNALLSPAPETIKTLDQFLDRKIHINFRKTAIIETVEVRNRLFHKRVLQVMANQPNLKLWEMHEGTRTILNGSAFLDEYSSVFLSINTQFRSDMICDLTVLNAGIFTRIFLYVKKNPHFKELHVRGLMRLKEHGLANKVKQIWIVSKLTCARVTEFIHVSLEAVSVALGIFAVGFLLSVMIFLFEIAYSHRKMRLMKIPLKKIPQKIISHLPKITYVR